MDFIFKLELPSMTMWGFIFSRLGLLILIWGVAFFVGRLVLSSIGGQDWNSLEIFTVGSLLGFCILGLTIFAMGFLHLYKKDIFWIATFVINIAGLLWLVTKVGKDNALQQLAFVWGRLSQLTFKPLLVLAVVFSYAMTLVPEVFYDALVYHIGLPHLFLLEGGYVDMPNVQFSRFPLLIQSLYVYALPLGGDSLAKMVHWAFLMLGALMIIMIVDRLKLSIAAGLAILLVLSIPVVQINVWTTAVDVGMGGLALAAFALILVWSQKEENNWGLLSLAGFFTGCVFGAKYTGVLFIFAINALLMGVLIQKKWAWWRGIQILFLFNIAAFLTLLPWLIRNVIYANNPLYPFLGSIFPNENLVVEKIAAQSAVSKGATPSSFWGWFLLPWSLSVTGFGSSFDFLGPAIVAFLPTVYFYKDQKQFWMWIVFFAAYFLSGGYLSRQTRYLLPGVMILAVFSGIGFGALLAQVRSTFWKGVFHFNATIMGATLLLWSVSVAAMSYSPQKVWAGKETREAYVTYYHPGMNPNPPNNLFEDINNLPPDAKLMFIGEEKVYGVPRPFVYSNVYDKTPFVEMANASESPDQLFEGLRSMGITHLVINLAEAARLKGYNLFPWRDDKKALVRNFFQEKTSLLTVKPVDGQNALVLLSMDGNPKRYPTWTVLAPGVEGPLELQIK